MPFQGDPHSSRTCILLIDPIRPDPFILQKVKVTLEHGGIVAYPTETFYGLGVDAFQAEAIQKLFRLKGRPAGVPVSVLVRDREMLNRLVLSVPHIAERIIEAFLPGPLTVVLRASQSLPKELIGETGTIGIRISSHPLITHMFAYCQSPFTTTSANPSGLPPATNAGMVSGYFQEGIDLLVDGGPVPGGMASTVVDASGRVPVVLREGAVSRDDLLMVAGRLSER